jgi:hypothetical protein
MFYNNYNNNNNTHQHLIIIVFILKRFSSSSQAPVNNSRSVNSITFNGSSSKLNSMLLNCFLKGLHHQL